MDPYRDCSLRTKQPLKPQASMLSSMLLDDIANNDRASTIEKLDPEKYSKIFSFEVRNAKEEEVNSALFAERQQNRKTSNTKLLQLEVKT